MAAGIKERLTEITRAADPETLTRTAGQFADVLVERLSGEFQSFDSRKVREYHIAKIGGRHFGLDGNGRRLDAVSGLWRNHVGTKKAVGRFIVYKLDEAPGIPGGERPWNVLQSQYRGFCIYPLIPCLSLRQTDGGYLWIGKGDRGHRRGIIFVGVAVKGVSGRQLGAISRRAASV